MQVFNPAKLAGRDWHSQGIFFKKVTERSPVAVATERSAENTDVSSIVPGAMTITRNEEPGITKRWKCKDFPESTSDFKEYKPL